MKRTIRWIALPVVLALIAVVIAVGGVITGNDEAEAQIIPPPSSMEERLDQFLAQVAAGRCDAISGGLVALPAMMWGGMRILPTLGVPATDDAHAVVSAAERQIAQALENFVNNNAAPCFEGEKEAAFVAKMMVEMLNEMAHALGAITAQCGVGSDLTTPPCNDLEQRVITFTDLEREPRQTTIEDGYSALVRSPLSLASFGVAPQQVALDLPGLRSKECSSTVLESGGIAVRLHLQKLSTTTYPWLTTFGEVVATQVPIWTIEILPVEYIKQLDICNQAGTVQRTITTDIVEDDQLAWLWQYAP